jgi:hypothetical protein
MEEHIPMDRGILFKLHPLRRASEGVLALIRKVGDLIRQHVSGAAMLLLITKLN